MNNKKKAEYIFARLNMKGADIGGVAKFYIEQALDDLECTICGNAETIKRFDIEQCDACGKPTPMYPRLCAVCGEPIAVGADDAAKMCEDCEKMEED